MVADSIAEPIRETGTFVKIRYRLRSGEGVYIKGDPGEGYAYLDFFSGYNQVMPALERRLLGRGAGETAEIRLSPEEAFGPYLPDQVRERRFEEFPEGKELQEGKWVLARDERTGTAYGYFVRKKEPDRVLLDYNHPLAGKELIYELEILEVRPTTPEERALLRPCEGES